MKKRFALMAAGLMVISSLTACGSSNSTPA
ncbi:hypothetical protein UYO_3050, partial [Lachnospiraceae bacterium JC7]